jgi:outer membrane protein assembly factor BamD (BamD/ComL family)
MFISEKFNKLKESNINPFRHEINNVKYLKGLFFEQVNSDKSTVLYTLKDVPHEGFPSFYQLYMAIRDKRVSLSLIEDHETLLIHSFPCSSYEELCNSREY